MTDHLEEIRLLLARALAVAPEAIDPDANLFAELGFDSFGLFNVMVEVEARHAIRFDEAELHGLQTARSVATYVGRLVDDRSVPAA